MTAANPLSLHPWGDSLELLQAANQLSLLLGQHAGEHGGLDEDLNEGNALCLDHSILTPAHPGYPGLCQLSRAEAPCTSKETPYGTQLWRVPSHGTHLGQQLSKVLTNHSEGFAVQGEVAGLRLQEASIPWLGQTLQGKTTPFPQLQPPGKALNQHPRCTEQQVKQLQVKLRPSKLHFRNINDGILDKELVGASPSCEVLAASAERVWSISSSST